MVTGARPLAPAAALAEDRAPAAGPLPVWAGACLALFLATLALYHLPWTRVSAGTDGLPLFPAFLVPLVPLAVARARAAIVGRLLPVVLMLLALVFCSLLTGIAHPGLDWAEALKRIGYLAMGIVLYVLVVGHPGSGLLAVRVYVLVTAGMAVYGFILLLGGAAQPLFYFGLHYTESTRNSDAYFLLVPAFLAVGLAASPSVRRRVWLRLPDCAAALILLAALVLSMSRGAWLSMTLGLLLLMPSLGRARAYLLVAVGAMTLLVAAVLPAMTDLPVTQLLADRLASSLQLNDAQGNSNLQRAELLQVTLGVVGSSPLTGTGVGLVQDELMYTTVSGLAHAENGYLNMFVEYGAGGFLMILAFTFWPLRQLTGRGPRPLLARAACCGLVAIAADSMFNTPQSTADFWILPLLLAAYGHDAGRDAA